VSAPVAALRGARLCPRGPALDLAVEPGERVALLGPNGAGKSTVLRALAGLSDPLSGAVLAARSVGYAPQEHASSLLPWLTAQDNIALATRGLRDAARASAAMHDALSISGLSRKALGRHPSALSGGEQQLVALARAVASDAPLLLLDEPFSAIARDARAAVRERLERHLDRALRAMVLVTHDPSDAALARRWIHLSAAGVVRDGPPTPRAFELVARPS
jgi:molybdate transport system ATP-binding protein